MAGFLLVFVLIWIFFSVNKKGQSRFNSPKQRQTMSSVVFQCLENQEFFAGKDDMKAYIIWLNKYNKKV